MNLQHMKLAFNQWAMLQPSHKTERLVAFEAGYRAAIEAMKYKPDPNCTCDPYGACAYCWNGKKHDTAPKPGEMK